MSIFFIVIAIILVLALCSYLAERREWNYGISYKSGKPWYSSGTDSSGARGFTDGCGHYIWISYASIYKSPPDPGS